MTSDIKDFYLNSLMEPKNYAYMCIPISMIPDKIMTEYKLAPLVHHRFVYVEIRKGVYGLPQVGRLANDRLTKLLAPHGYALFRSPPASGNITPSHSTSHSSSMDAFSVIYTNKADAAEHLIHTLRGLYSVTEDWAPKQYCGLTLEFTYAV
jgi:hypothetical protein